MPLIVDLSAVKIDQEGNFIFIKSCLQIVQTRRHVISGVSIEVSKAFSKEDQSKPSGNYQNSQYNSSARKAFVNGNNGYYGYDAFAWAGGFRGGATGGNGGRPGNGVPAVRGRPNGRR